jgi:hypothetical protein
MIFLRFLKMSGSSNLLTYPIQLSSSYPGLSLHQASSESYRNYRSNMQSFFSSTAFALVFSAQKSYHSMLISVSPLCLASPLLLPEVLLLSIRVWFCSLPNSQYLEIKVTGKEIRFYCDKLTEKRAGLLSQWPFSGIWVCERFYEEEMNRVGSNEQDGYMLNYTCRLHSHLCHQGMFSFLFRHSLYHTWLWSPESDPVILLYKLIIFLQVKYYSFS